MTKIEIAQSKSMELRNAEKVIDKAIENRKTAHLELGNALREIRDARLYRETHSSFGKYCKDKCGFSRSWAYELIQFAQVMETISG